jgi:hypothetical protein
VLVPVCGHQVDLFEGASRDLTAPNRRRAGGQRAANGSEAAPSRADFAAVRAQSAQSLLSTPGMTLLNDELKQTLAEKALFQAAAIEAARSGVRGDGAQQRALAQAIIESTRRSSGIDLTNLRMTPQGLLPKS